MVIYLDMCALKRPFDDQGNNRIWIETQAVIRILAMFSDKQVRICNSAALVFENNRNPNPLRKKRVDILLRLFGNPADATDIVFTVAGILQKSGLNVLDSMHLAFADKMHASYFITCDDQILDKSDKLNLRVKIIDPPLFVREVAL